MRLNDDHPARQHAFMSRKIYDTTAESTPSSGSIAPHGILENDFQLVQVFASIGAALGGVLSAGLCAVVNVFGPARLQKGHSFDPRLQLGSIIVAM